MRIAPASDLIVCHSQCAKAAGETAGFGLPRAPATTFFALGWGERLPRHQSFSGGGGERNRRGGDAPSASPPPSMIMRSGHFMCLLTSLVISNIETLPLPLN